MASKTKSEQAIALLSEINADAFEGDEAARVNTIAAARALLNRLETPIDRCYEMMSISWLWGVLQTYKDLGIWEAWAKDRGEKSIQDLAALANTDVDVNLLRALPSPFLHPSAVENQATHVTLHAHRSILQVLSIGQDD